jgi:hypothetical protein
MKLKFFNTAFAALILTTSLLISTAHAGLIHSYDYNGNANDGTGSANGTVTNATLTSDRFGNSNSAYLFNGESYINSSFTSPSTASFSIWATLGTQSDAGDMLFTANGTRGTDLWLYPGCNAIFWNTWDSCANPFNGGAEPTDLRDGNFHHYVVINDQSSNSTSLYIDGDLFGTAGYRNASGSNFQVGAAPASRAWGWDGKIDEVYIYDTALSSSDVSSLYTTGSVQVPEPTTLAIFALGMMGLASRRFKKNS